MNTKYNFNKVKLCDSLNDEKLKKLGFTNYYEPHWCFCRTISRSKTDNFSETFNLTIKENFTKMDIDILDEAFCQPFVPVCKYYMNECSFESLTPYCQEAVKKCDEYIQFLVNNNVIYFEGIKEDICL